MWQDLHTRDLTWHDISEGRGVEGLDHVDKVTFKRTALYKQINFRRHWSQTRSLSLPRTPTRSSSLPTQQRQVLPMQSSISYFFNHVINLILRILH